MFDEFYFKKTYGKNFMKQKKASGCYFNLFKREGTKKENKILDIGCANGFFLKHCDDFGLETYGIDISDFAINNAKKYTKAKLTVSNINKPLTFEDNSFDYITLFDVIEHIESPVKLLREINRTLKPKGVLIIRTPNLNSLERLVRGKKFIGFRDETHLYFFTSLSLKLLVERIGFSMVKLETHFYPFPKFLKKTKLAGNIWLVANKLN